MPLSSECKRTGLQVPVDHVTGGDGQGPFGGTGGKRFQIEGRGFHVLSRPSRGIRQRPQFLHELNDRGDVIVVNGMRQNFFRNPLFILAGAGLEKVK